MNLFRRRPLVTYFVLAFVFSWLVTLLMIVRYNGQSDIPGWLHYLVAWGPALSALVVTAITEGWAGIGQLLGRLFRWRLSLADWLLAVGTPLLLLAVAVLISRIVNNTMPDLALLGQVDYLGNIGIPASVLVWILSFGVGEEIGWRGFAQHHLERQRGFLYSVMLIGLIWAFWHIPHFFYKDTFIAMGLAGFPLFALNILPGAIVLGWLYNRTHSILAVGLWHGLFDFGTAAAVDNGTVSMAMSILVTLWALLIIAAHLRGTASLRAQTGA